MSVKRTYQKLPQPVLVSWGYIRKHYLEYPLLAVILLSVIAPALNSPLERLKSDRYKLDKVSSLLTSTPASLKKDITYDTKAAAYTFTPPADQQSQATTANTQSVGGVKYSASLATDAKQGISLTDTSNKLSISLTPQFDTQPAKQIDGHVVYPVSGSDSQLVYTFKGNGLKEDIVLYGSDTSEASFSYTLKLPTALKAKLLSDGSIGIYGGDSSLYGNISYGSDKDKALVQKAQANSAKNTLMYVIPAPTVKAANNKNNKVKASFSLRNNHLTVHAINLTGANYPLTIDPSLALASTSDWASGNNESNIELTQPNQISRGALTGATVPSWGDANNGGASFTIARTTHASVVYQGYIYVLGGQHASNDTACNVTASIYCSDVQFAPINTATGQLGTWATTTSFTGARQGHNVVAYNGFMYVIGGYTTTTTNDTQYARINADGTLGTWITSSSFSQTRLGQYAVAYNGFMYVSGGCYSAILPCDTILSDVQYAPINPNGTIGTWAATTSFTTARLAHVMVAYNNILYIVGGRVNGAKFSDVQYAPINPNGTIGTWTATASFTTARNNHTAGVTNGYMYIEGGCTAGDTCSTFANDVQYARINANGSLGSWSASTSFTTGRYGQGSIFYRGYLYLTGGYNGSYFSDVQYAKIDPAGTTTVFTTNANTYTTGRVWYGSIAYAGYLYIIGGSTSDGSCNATLNTLSDVQYAPINSDGSVGTFAATSSLIATELATAGRCGFGLGIYNNTIYIIGGGSNTGATPIYHTDVLYASVNANGTLGTWTAASNKFTSGRAHNGGAIYNGYLYVLGGLNASLGYYNDVQYTPINSDGSLGAFAATTNLPSARAFATVATNAGKIYVYSGYNGTSLSDIQYATMNNDGTLGTWQATTSTPDANAESLSFSNGMAYLYGGSYVYRAPLAADGSVGTWVQQVNQSTYNYRSNYLGVIYNGILYRTGGCINFNGTTCAAFTTRVEYAVINNGGSGATGAWTTSGNTFTTGRHRFGAAVATNGYLYIVGGCKGTVVSACGSAADAAVNALGDIQYAQINSNGSLGAFTTSTISLPTPRSSFGMTSLNGYLYVSGGYDNAAATTGSTIYAQLTSAGPIATDSGCGSAWCTGPTIALRGYVSLASQGNYVYAVGQGVIVYYASVQPGGNLNAWQTGTNLQVGRTGASLVVNAGFLYVINGFITSGNTILNSVEYASINPATGAIGSFAYTAATQNAQWGGAAVVYDGYIYRLGGNGTTGSAEYASVLAGGQLSPWTNTTSFTTNRFANGAAVYNGYVYTMGGCNDGNCATPPLSDTQYASMQSISRKARYSKLFTTDKDVTPVNMFQNSSSTNNSLSISYQQAILASPIFGSVITPSFTPNSSTNLVTTQGSYFLFNFVMDDSQNASFPDSASNPTTLSYFKLNYHPTNTQRLHGGKTFNSGAQQSLDAP